MCESVGNYTSLGLSLKIIIADCIGSGECLFNISGLKIFFIMMCKDACIKVGLQFEFYRELVVFRFAHLLAGPCHFFRYTHEVLDMMAYLMCNDVGHGKITGYIEPLLQFIIK